MTEILGLIQIVLLIIVLVVVFVKKNGSQTDEMLNQLTYLQKQMERIEARIGEESRAQREELLRGLKDSRLENREVMNAYQQASMNSLTEISRLQAQQLDVLTRSNQEALDRLTRSIDVKILELIDKNNIHSKELRDSLSVQLKDFGVVFSQNVRDFNEMQRQKFSDLVIKQEELTRLAEQKLEKMRETVDEKLEKTLEARLGQSFNLVSSQLQEVQKGLGEMQNLAANVGDLKKVLSNVKNRGIIGEVQLGAILEQVLAPEQYATNVKTNPSARELVEYAIKLPGKDESQQVVYLPVDAKFPLEVYSRLIDAREQGDMVLVAEASKAFESAIKKAAKDICDKYIYPPFTTDFGIMFLPVEGMFAEVVGKTTLMEQLQREYKVIVTGPTTLSAILSSLQMGFRTLAVQKRSGEVWKVLAAVKTEFQKFGGILEKARKKINEAGDEIDTLVGARSRIIERRLRDIQELPAHDAESLLNGVQDVPLDMNPNEVQNNE